MRKGKQMMAPGKPVAGAPLARYRWDDQDWLLINKRVKRLQVRIAQATKAKRFGKVKALQWLLTHSFSAKAWAVRRVVRNRGRRTAGVDGVKWQTSRQKMAAILSLKRCGYKPKALRRIYSSTAWARAATRWRASSK
jgi:RNA-directed DNA polymerase